MIANRSIKRNFPRTSCLTLVLVMAMAVVTAFTVDPACASGGSAGQGKFMVIANKNVPEGDLQLSKFQLKEIFLVNRKTWSDGKGIVLVVFLPEEKSGNAEVGNILEEITGMGILQAKKYYIQKVFTGVLSEQPIYGKDPKEIIDLVAENAGAIGFIPTGALLKETKTVNLKD